VKKNLSNNARNAYKSLQAKRDGVSSSAIADYVISPACLNSLGDLYVSYDTSQKGKPIKPKPEQNYEAKSSF
jgi:hypothetical protein